MSEKNLLRFFIVVLFGSVVSILIAFIGMTERLGIEKIPFMGLLIAGGASFLSAVIIFVSWGSYTRESPEKNFRGWAWTLGSAVVLIYGICGTIYLWRIEFLGVPIHGMLLYCGIVGMIISTSMLVYDHKNKAELKPGGNGPDVCGEHFCVLGRGAMTVYVWGVIILSFLLMRPETRFAGATLFWALVPVFFAIFIFWALVHARHASRR